MHPDPGSFSNGLDPLMQRTQTHPGSISNKTGSPDAVDPDPPRPRIHFKIDWVPGCRGPGPTSDPFQNRLGPRMQWIRTPDSFQMDWIPGCRGPRPTPDPFQNRLGPRMKWTRTTDPFQKFSKKISRSKIFETSITRFLLLFLLSS